MRISILLILVIACLMARLQAQSTPLAGDRGRVTVASIPDPYGGPNLKVLRTDTNTPLRAGTAWIWEKQRQEEPNSYYVSMRAKGLNSVRMILFDTWEVEAYTPGPQFTPTNWNDAAYRTRQLARMERAVNYASANGMYIVINGVNDLWVNQTCERLGLGWSMWFMNGQSQLDINWPIMMADANAKGWNWVHDVLPTTSPTFTSPGTATFSQDIAGSHAMSATGGSITYAVEGLPAGLLLNTSSGIISGTTSLSVVLKTAGGQDYSLSLTPANGGWVDFSAPLSTFTANNFNFSATGWEILLVPNFGLWGIGTSTLRLDFIEVLRREDITDPLLPIYLKPSLGSF